MKRYYRKIFKGAMTIFLIGLTSELLTQIVNASERCTYTIKGKASYTFSCRWLVAGTPKTTIFVDNNDTGDRYTVSNTQWKVGPSSNCISKYIATVCNQKKWW